jgi:hypothetical protein
MPPVRVLAIAVSALGFALIGAGCGSSSGSSTQRSQTPHLSQKSSPTLRRSRKRLAQATVTAMVLHDGDLPGFRLQSMGGETLKDQLPPPRSPHRALAERLVQRNWIASEHSAVVSEDGRVALFSDANLFKTATAAKRIWRLELAPQPGVQQRVFKTPAGAPAGARLAYLRKGRRAFIQIGWRQGRVIGIALIGAKPHQKFSRIGVRRVTAFMARAASAEAKRITNAARSTAI